jgi:hypothetical protein
MYTPSLQILGVLKSFGGKASSDFLVSQTGIKRADIEESLENLRNEGVIKRDDGTVYLVNKDTDSTINKGKKR